MKASVCAGILLFILLALVVFNAWYVRKTTERMLSMIRELPQAPASDTPESIIKFQMYFEEQERYLRITVSYLLSDRIKELSDTLLLYAETGMAGDYWVTRALLEDAVKDMGRTERLWQRDKA